MGGPPLTEGDAQGELLGGQGPLLRVAGGEDGVIRAQAVQNLGRTYIPLKNSRELLVEALKSAGDDFAKSRQNALQGLQRSDDRELLPLFLAALSPEQEPNAEVRNTALNALDTYRRNARVREDDVVEAVRARLITWLRIKRAPDTTQTSTSSTTGPAPQTAQASASLSARITWVGVNASRVYQAVPVFNEIVGTVPGPLNTTGVPGEPDQVYFLAHGNVLPGSVALFLQASRSIFLFFLLFLRLSENGLLNRGGCPLHGYLDGSEEFFPFDLYLGPVLFHL